MKTAMLATLFVLVGAGTANAVVPPSAHGCPAGVKLYPTSRVDVDPYDAAIGASVNVYMCRSWPHIKAVTEWYPTGSYRYPQGTYVSELDLYRNGVVVEKTVNWSGSLGDSMDTPQATCDGHPNLWQVHLHYFEWNWTSSSHSWVSGMWTGKWGSAAC